MTGVRPHWTTYFTVDDADEAAREAVGLGAKIHVALRDIPGIGRFCGITSPQGVAFNVIRWTR
jgi:predicted enzyme related to lactoylglutathione lyase